MTTIEQTLRNAAVNGVINIDKAIKALTPYDQEREATMELLKVCEKEVGLFNGEKINVHLAAMQGTYFNEVEYNYEKPVGEQ